MISLEKRWKALDTLLALGVTILFGIVLAYFVDFYYDINDDLLIKDILAGVYTGTPSGYNIQMLYPISRLISFFYEVVPSLPWYGLFLCGGHFLCIFLIGKRLVAVTNKLWKKILLLLVECLILVGLLLYELTFVQYTVSCGLFAATGAFWFYTTDSSLSVGKFFRENIISILLVVVAFYIRTEMLLLVFPMICVLGFCKWADASKITGKQIRGRRKIRIQFFTKENTLKYVTVIGSILVGMGLGIFADASAYSSTKWENFNQLFDSRTEIYDFLGIPYAEYEENIEIYKQVGLSRPEYQLIKNYNYILDESIDHNMMQQIETLKNAETDYFRNNLMDGLYEYKERLSTKIDAPWIYMVWICYLAIIALMIMEKNWSFLWKLSMLFGARSLSWMYIIMRGRVLPRITVPLYFVEFLILVAILIIELKNVTTKEKVLYRRFFPTMVTSMLCVLAFGSFTNVVPKVQEEQVSRAVTNREWQGMQAYCREYPENLYLLDCYSTVRYSEKMFEDVDNSLANYQYAGGWACKSPIEIEKLELFGIHQVETDLYTKENLFFISYGSYSIDWIKEFYHEKGIGVVIIRVDTIPFERNDTYEVYQVKQLKPIYKKESKDVN